MPALIRNPLFPLGIRAVAVLHPDSDKRWSSYKGQEDEEPDGQPYYIGIVRFLILTQSDRLSGCSVRMRPDASGCEKGGWQVVHPGRRNAAWPVSKAVGNVRNQGPSLVEPVTAL